MYLIDARKENGGYLIVFYVMFFGRLVIIAIVFKDIISLEICGIIPVIALATLFFRASIFQLNCTLNVIVV